MNRFWLGKLPFLKGWTMFLKLIKGRIQYCKYEIVLLVSLSLYCMVLAIKSSCCQMRIQIQLLIMWNAASMIAQHFYHWSKVHDQMGICSITRLVLFAFVAFHALTFAYCQMLSFSLAGLVHPMTEWNRNEAKKFSYWHTRISRRFLLLLVLLWCLGCFFWPNEAFIKVLRGVVRSRCPQKEPYPPSRLV